MAPGGGRSFLGFGRKPEAGSVHRPGWPPRRLTIDNRMGDPLPRRLRRLSIRSRAEVGAWAGRTAGWRADRSEIVRPSWITPRRWTSASLRPSPEAAPALTPRRVRTLPSDYLSQGPRPAALQCLIAPPNNLQGKSRPRPASRPDHEYVHGMVSRRRDKGRDLPNASRRDGGRPRPPSRRGDTAGRP